MDILFRICVRSTDFSVYLLVFKNFVSRTQIISPNTIESTGFSPYTHNYLNYKTMFNFNIHTENHVIYIK